MGFEGLWILVQYQSDMLADLRYFWNRNSLEGVYWSTLEVGTVLKCFWQNLREYF